MTSSTLEFEASVVGAVAEVGDGVTIVLAPAVIHRSEGIAGVDPGTRWLQQAELVFTAAELEGETPALPAAMARGKLRAGVYTYLDMLPVPTEGVGPAAFDLEFADGSRLAVIGETVTLRLHGDAKYVEHTNVA
jgi:hypothetical protein